MSPDERREAMVRVFAEHGYADSDVYGECFCKGVFEDAYDMADHIYDELEKAGIE